MAAWRPSWNYGTVARNPCISWTCYFLLLNGPKCIWWRWGSYSAPPRHPTAGLKGGLERTGEWETEGGEGEREEGGRGRGEGKGRTPNVWSAFSPMILLYCCHLAYHRMNGSSSPVLTATCLSYGSLCDLIFFLEPNWRSHPSTDFDAKWLKRRGFTQVRAFWS